MRPGVWGRSRHLLADVCNRALDEQGQGLIEYAFVVMLIALVLILIVAVLGHQTNTLYTNASNALPK
jgi:Flp pilus assembly pilin Flp